MSYEQLFRSRRHWLRPLTYRVANLELSRERAIPTKAAPGRIDDPHPNGRIANLFRRRAARPLPGY